MLYRDLQYFKGSLIDTMGAIGTPTSATFSPKEKGYALETSNGKYVTYDKQLLPNGAFSVVVWARLRNSNRSTSDRAATLGSTNGGGGFNLLISSGSGTSNYDCMMWLGDTNYRYFTWAKDFSWHCFIFIVPGSGINDIDNSLLYIDGISKSSTSTLKTSAQTSRSNIIYVGGGNTTTGGAHISRIKVYDTVIDQLQIQKEQEEFNNARMLAKQKRGAVLNKVNDLSREVNNTLKTQFTDLFTVDSSSSWTGANTLSRVWSSDGNLTFNADGVGAMTIVRGSVFIVGAKITMIVRAKSNSLTSKLVVWDGSNYIESDKTLSTEYRDFIWNDLVTSTGTITLKNSGANATLGQNITVDSIQVFTKSGLIFASNMKPKGNTLVDISGNGNNGICSSVINTKNGLLFNGLNSAIPITGNNGLTGDITISARVYLKSEGGGGDGRIFDNSKLLLFCGSQFRFSRDGIALTASAIISLTTKKWYSITVISNSLGTTNFYVNGVLSGTTDQASGIPVSSTAWNIGNRPALNRGFDGELVDLRIHNRILTPQEIKSYSNSWISPTFTETFENEGADGSTRVPTGWIKGTGNYGVKQLTTDVISGGLMLKKGTKYLENLSAGTISFPNNWVNGAVEFSWYKGGDGNSVIVQFINSTYTLGINELGYRISFNPSEALQLSRGAVGSGTLLLSTSTSYIQNFTWYTTRIERTNAGQFTLLIKGGNFVPTAGRNGWTLVSTTGGSGSNPVTDITYNTSSYSVLSCGIGDRITNIRFYDGVIQI